MSWEMSHYQWNCVHLLVYARYPLPCSCASGLLPWQRWYYILVSLYGVELKLRPSAYDVVLYV